MEPHLANHDKRMFYKYLDEATVYFEYGSGGSTYQASIRDNITKIYSVESDISWQNQLRKNVSNNKIIYIFNDMCTQPNTWGNPGSKATNDQKINYSNHITKLSEEEYNKIDLVLIDGRFRVACCLKCHTVIGDNCLVAFDDFLNRKHYHVVLDYFDIVDKTQNNRMVILKKRSGTVVPSDLIEKYELVSA